MKPASPGRNDSCPCGSGKKLKQCCMLRPAAQVTNPAVERALVHFESGNYPAAIQICQRILQTDPQHHEAMTLLGVLAFYVGNAQAAIQILEKSLEVNPQQADARNNLGEIYRASSKFQQAFFNFENALTLNPRHLAALINLGNALQDIYRYDDAIAMYERALEIKPDHAGALSNLANAFQQLYRHEEAIAIFSRLLQVAPDYDWALGGRMYSRIHCCDWQDYDENVAGITQKIREGKKPIKVFELRPISDSPELELLCARTFAEALYPPVEAKLGPRSSLHGKLKIAYLSADFRQHPVSQLLVEVLERHDKSAFEVLGISFGPDDGSEVRKRVLNTFDQFYDVRQKSDEEVVTLLRSQNVDIAIDLMGYTTHARPAIFAQCCAPVQVSYLGYAGTTGAKNMDYIIADDVIIPEQNARFYSEKVLRLPAPLLPRDTRLQAGGTPSRVEAGLPANGLVFCAFNNHYKITPAIFNIWMRLLKEADESVLWLSNANDMVKKNLRKEAEARGITGSRIIFAERTELLESHFARHALADFFLDTYPYNAHTTASDALWSGLPVITCGGNIFAARVAASLLRALDMNELVTDSLEAYENLALSLSRDPDKVQFLKSRLMHNKAMLPVFDPDRYVKNLEEALLEAARISRS